MCIYRAPPKTNMTMEKRPFWRCISHWTLWFPAGYVSLLKVDLSISSIYSWVFSRSNSKIRTSSQELKSDSNPFQISQLFVFILIPNWKSWSLFSKNKIFQKVVLPGVFLVCQETSFRRPMSPASDNSLMEGAMATAVGAEENVSYSCISIGLRESWQPWHFVGWFTDFTVSNMATSWLVGRYCFFSGGSRSCKG